MAEAPKASKVMTILGWLLTIAPAGLLAFSGVMKLMGGEDLAKGFEHLGWPIGHARTLAIIELGCVLVLLFPKTATLGAVLVTGYMGGAMATHLRIHEPVIVQCLVGVVVWLGLFLREPRLRAILPLR
jgi:hypothetical protein